MYYTGKGDKGTTSLGGGKPTGKHTPAVSALGAVDELNSITGLCRARAEREDREVADILKEVQHRLFTLQSAIAGSGKEITSEHVSWAEGVIRRTESEFPPIRSFVLPGATELSALLDVARTVTRRAERETAMLCKIEHLSFCDGVLPSFMNRLSSLFYVLARLAAHRGGVSEDKPEYR